jgi:hypothetical protein
MYEEVAGQRLHTIIAQSMFVKHAALAFPSHIGHPDTANAKSGIFSSGVNFLPERLIEFLVNISDSSFARD